MPHRPAEWPLLQLQLLEHDHLPQHLKLASPLVQCSGHPVLLGVDGWHPGRWPCIRRIRATLADGVAEIEFPGVQPGRLDKIAPQRVDAYDVRLKSCQPPGQGVDIGLYRLAGAREPLATLGDAAFPCPAQGLRAPKPGGARNDSRFIPGWLHRSQ